MNHNILDLVDSQVRKAQLYEDAQSDVKEVKAEQIGIKPVVTISRQLGSGGRRVAEILAESLKFSLWDGELVEQVATDAHVANHLVNYFDEQIVSEIDVLLRHLVGEPKIGGFQYKRHLTRTILQIARIGNSVILGRGASFVLPHALNVRIIATKELRIHNMMEFESKTRDEASRQVDESDKIRNEFTRRIWGRSWDDPLYYDMVIRMDEITNQQCAQIIKESLLMRKNED